MRTAFLLLVITSLGCDSLWGGFLVPHPGPCGGDQRCQGQLFSIRPEVDALLVIDNSQSMRKKQAALAQRIGPFFERLDRLGVDYHVGLTSSDVGNWPMGGTFPPSRGCQSFAGDDGAFQRAACSERQLDGEGRTSCMSLCPDPSFVPGQDLDFIFRSAGYTNIPRDINGSVDYGPTRAFRCLSLLGEGGCDIEGTLEAARRAVDGHSPRNMGFVRQRSVLLLMFLTDEDDCSVSSEGRGENEPVERRNCIADGTDPPDYRCFNPDYRCMGRSVVCTERLTKEGAKMACVERESSYLTPVDSYVRFFKDLHREDKLMVVGLWPPKLGGPGTRFEVVAEPGGDNMDSYDLNRATGDNPGASCQNRTDGIYGRPQLRLSRFGSQFKHSLEINVCTPNDYISGLASVGKNLESQLVNCLDLVPMEAEGQPACVVGHVEEWTGRGPDDQLPVCGASCCAAWASASAPLATNPMVVAACQAETAPACYCAVKSTQPAVCQGGVIAGIWRTVPPPENRAVSFTCAVQ